MTYADSAPKALGMSRNRRHEPVAPSLEPYYVLATDLITGLEPGDQLRDHGRLRAIAGATYSARPGASVEVRFDDDGDLLTIAPHEHVTVWRQAA